MENKETEQEKPTSLVMARTVEDFLSHFTMGSPQHYDEAFTLGGLRSALGAYPLFGSMGDPMTAYNDILESLGFHMTATPSGPMLFLLYA